MSVCTHNIKTACTHPIKNVCSGARPKDTVMIKQTNCSWNSKFDSFQCAMHFKCSWVKILKKNDDSIKPNAVKGMNQMMNTASIPHFLILYLKKETLWWRDWEESEAHLISMKKENNLTFKMMNALWWKAIITLYRYRQHVLSFTTSSTLVIRLDEWNTF